MLVTVARLAIDRTTNTPVVFLKEVVGDRAVAIWVGAAEATSIAMALHGEAAPRPMTHDLFPGLLRSLGGDLIRVAVTAVRDGTYIAELQVRRPDDLVVILDSRPSDALAIALRLKVPVLCSAALLHLEGVQEPPPHDPLSADALREHLRRLGPEDFGRFVP